MGISRAAFPVDLTYLVTLLAPLAALISFQLAKQRRFAQHRALQLTALVVCWASVLGFELHLRLTGGSGEFVRAARPEHQAYARVFLLVHIATAVLTYVLWTWLATVSSRRFGTRLPGDFSARHRALGKLVFVGLCFTALSATGMYFEAFVL